jgi:hypothetical protein
LLLLYSKNRAVFTEEATGVEDQKFVRINNLFERLKKIVQQQYDGLTEVELKL